MSEHWYATSSPESRPRVAAVIVAAGAGYRMGSRVRKQYATLLDEPVLAWAIRAFADHPRVDEVVVVLPPQDVETAPAWLRNLGAMLVGGGAQRSDSVRNGLGTLRPDTDLVLVHDGARPFVGADLIERLIAAAARGPVIPGVRATDTLKERDEEGFVTRTLDRARVWHAQTPQAFPFQLLNATHQRALVEGWAATDDASLCERVGVPVRIIEGDPANMKITFPLDLAIARAIAAEQRSRSPKAARAPHQTE